MIWTIGHSTRSADVLLILLRTNNIRQVADVRTAPYSRRHPQFNSDALDEFLNLHGIAYRHFAALGGLRKPRPDSTNTAWRESGFRGYADYMETPAFRRGLEDLLRFAESGPTTVMCAEAVWWRCHRRIIADYLLAAGAEVVHILSAARKEPARMTAGAVPQPDGTIHYPDPALP